MVLALALALAFLPLPLPLPLTLAFTRNPYPNQAGQCEHVWALCMHHGSHSNGTLTARP